MPTPIQNDEDLWAELTTLCSDIAVQNESALSQICLTTSTQSYQTAMEAALRPANKTFALNGEIDKCLDSFNDAQGRLSSIEQSLAQIITSLQDPSAKLSETTREITFTMEKVNALALINDQVATVAEKFRLPQELAEDIRGANPHSDKFRSALAVLSVKITTTDMKAYQDAPGCVAIKGLVDELRETALSRVEQRLKQSLELLANPASNFEILQNALLRDQEHLLQFISKHEKQLSQRISREYVSVASKAVLAEMKSYCSVFNARRGQPSGQNVSLDISSLSSGTSDMLFAIFSETFADSSETADGKRRGEESVHAADEGHVLRRGPSSNLIPKYTAEVCFAALQRSTSASLSKAELIVNSRVVSSMRLDEVFQNCATHFLEHATKESDFLQQSFGEYALLDEVFQNVNTPVLSLFEEEIQAAKHLPSFLASLLLSLFFSRAHRSRIYTQNSIDVRISFLVKAEKLLQTVFIQYFDRKRDNLIHMPDLSMKQGPTDIHCAVWVLEHAEFIQDVHNVVVACSSQIRADDLVDIVKRKLQSFCNEMHGQISLAALKSMDKALRSKLRLRCYASLLSLLRGTGKYCVNDCICGVLKEPMEKVFDSSALHYSGLMVSKHTAELLHVDSRIDSLQSIRANLDVFRADFAERVRTISEEFNFLDAPEIAAQYAHAARKSAFKSLSDANNRVTFLMQRKWPNELHLVVSNSALAHAVMSVTRQNS